MDSSEGFRRAAVAIVNSQVEKEATEDSERKRLEEFHGQVWDTQELSRDFVVHGFMAPFIMATRKADNVEGLLTFQHSPRFYWGFEKS